MILDYILKFHLQDCLNILSENDNLGYFNIKIDFLKLFETYPDVGDQVLCSPIESLPLCHKDIVKAQKIILENNEYKEVLMKLSYFYLKNNVFARFFGLPVCPELHRTVFPKNIDLGCFLKVTGTVVRVTQSKMLEYQRKYVCVKCKFENCVEADFENRYILKTPTKCGNKDPKCRSSTFSQVNLVSREHCRDYQEIKIQEQVNKLSVGTIPGSLWVVLEDDLVDCCKPGDDVIICGTVRRRWRPSVHNRKSEVELVLQANYLEVCNAQRSEVIATAPDVKECFNEYWAKYESCPLKGRDHILKSVCPQVYGLHVVKLAVLLTVITGSNSNQEERDKTSSHDDKHSTRVRGQCHLLLVGDPGTGKSQLLRASSELTVRSVFTTGAGSTRAGLTCAALREDGEWQLEAGALVLSDGGVCCIDEISQLREHDRTAIHEAMEQQTISIAKAGIVCKLNTRCAIIAACNPKGHYDTDQSLSVNVSLGTPLLSRFDLIFILLDSKNKSWDKLVSSYILFGGSNLQESKKLWSLEKLQMYISLVGPRSTKMTKSANIILQSYYMTQRKSQCRDASRTTVRMLDSLVRLSQAHCRLMYRDVILPMDAIIAVSLVDLSMQDCTLSDTVNALHSTFQNYPDFEYLCMARKLLIKLNLDEIWSNELLYYGKLLQVDHKTLENDIDKGITRLFAKCDDISDDNIHLSSSLVTSSYFNKNKPADDNNLNLDFVKENSDKLGKISDDTEKDSTINKNLASTLKKHANLNKCERKPSVAQRRGQNKRKRKEITINSTTTRNKITKNNKKTNLENDIDNKSDSEEMNAGNILNAVPSVNDAFMELGVDFKFEDSLHNEKNNYNKINNVEENICIKEEPNETRDTFNDSYSKELDNKNKCDNVEDKSNGTEVKKKDEYTSKTADKLKQFQFEEKHDFKKYDEIHQVSVLKHQVSNVNADHNNGPKSYSSKSVQSSQLSLFESSDCEIDLDI